MPVLTHLLAAMIGGTFGLLVAALAAASQRADYLADLVADYENNDEEVSDNAVFIATEETLDRETLDELVAELEERIGGRVIILDGYTEEGDDE